jgi:hypothetical protein
MNKNLSMGAKRNPGLAFPLYWPSVCGNSWILTLEAGDGAGDASTFTSCNISEKRMFLRQVEGVFFGNAGCSGSGHLLSFV